MGRCWSVAGFCRRLRFYRQPRRDPQPRWYLIVGANTLRAQVSLEWVKSAGDRRATCVDMDQSVLGWGSTHNVATSPSSVRERLDVVCADVLGLSKVPHFDVICAVRLYTTPACSRLSPLSCLMLHNLCTGPRTITATNASRRGSKC